MSEMLNMFKAILIIQMFFSVAITGIAYAIPDSAKHFLTSYSDLTQTVNLQNISGSVQTSLQRQTTIPIIELGALVFYSGNILIDLLLNFAYALPQMIGLLINSIMLLLNVDSYIFALVEIFCSVIISVLYLVGIIQLISNARSQAGGIT